MANFTETTNYKFKKPTVGADTDQWGSHLNETIDGVDSQLKTLADSITTQQLEQLGNVVNVTPVDDQFLRYNGTNWTAETVSIPDALNDLSNVSGTPSSGDVLTYNGTAWSPASVTSAAVADGSVTNAKLHPSLQTVIGRILVTDDDDSPTDNQILVYSTSDAEWKYADQAGSTLQTLTDVSTTGLSDGDLLTYDGTAGEFVFIDASAARTLLNVDVSGTDNSTPVTLNTTSHDYLTLSSQQLTLGPIVLTDDVSGTLPIANGGTSATTAAGARTSLGLGTLATQSTITESQISDLGSYITASSTDTLINKSGNISQWTNDSNYLTAETNDLGSAVTGTLGVANGGTGLTAIGTANQVLAVNAGATALEFQTLATGGTVTSVAVSGSDGIEVDSGSPITTSGTIALGINAATLGSHLSLGTAATTASTDYATAAQGALADSAVQPGDDANTLGSGAATDGYVLTADGAGGAAWEQILAVQTNATNTFSANQIISVADDTNAALRITQTGTGNALVVEDDTNPDSTPFVVNSIGRIGIGTVNPASSLDIASAGIRVVAGRKIASNVDEDSLVIIGGTAGAESAEIQLYGGSHSTSPSLLVLEGDEQRFRTAAGTERMRIDSSGNLGIGTDAPTEKLDVTGNINATGALTLGTALAVAEGGTGVTSLSSLDAADLGSGAATDGYVLTADGAGGAAWEAASGGGASLPIDLLSSGASIQKSDGTTAVLSESGGTVTLENASLGDTVLMPDNSNNVSTAPGIRFEADTDTGIGLASAGNLAVVTGGAERMRIDSSGNVGINTTSPDTELHVSGYVLSGLNDLLTIHNSSGGAGSEPATVFKSYNGKLARIGAVDNGSGLGTLKFYTSGTTDTPTERMRIDSSGNVGIGTTSPSTRLEVSGSGDTLVRITGGAGNAKGVEFYKGSGTATQLYNVSDDLRILTNASERMRIDSSGNALIGYTSSNGSYKLQVNSQIYATSAIIQTSDGRYKENVTSLDGALNLVAQLNPVQFTWKEHPVHEFDRSQPTVGFIAQEVQEVLKDTPYVNSIIKANECTIEDAVYETIEISPAIPEELDENGEIITPAQDAVTEQRLVSDAVTEEFLGIAEGNLIALLTKALQEANAKIDALETRIQVLEV